MQDKTGDTVRCKKLLAGGFDSLVTKQRAEQIFPSPVPPGDNNLLYFWQELCLIEDRFVLEPLLWTMLLAADLTPRLASLGLILARVMAIEHVLEGAGMTVCSSDDVQWAHMAMSLNATFIQGSDPRCIVEVMIEVNRYVLLAGSIATLVQRLRPHSIHDIFDTVSTRSQGVWWLGLPPPAMTSVIYFCILSLVVLKWPPPNSYDFNIDPELVVRWKEDHTDLLCGQLTALLLSILISRIPYARKLIMWLVSELMDCCMLVVSTGCIIIAKVFLQILHHILRWAPLVRILGLEGTRNSLDHCITAVSE